MRGIADVVNRIGAIHALVQADGISGFMVSPDDPRRIFDVNVAGTANLLEFARSRRLRRLVPCVHHGLGPAQASGAVDRALLCRSAVGSLAPIHSCRRCVCVHCRRAEKPRRASRACTTSPRERSSLAHVRDVVRSVMVPLEVEFDETNDVAAYRLPRMSIRHAAQHLGYRPKVTLEEGVASLARVLAGGVNEPSGTIAAAARRA